MRAREPAAAEEASLLQMVLDRRDDDEPRLVFADWLLERGDPRGALIQMQCHYEALPAGDPTRQGLALRIRKLIAERGEAIAADVARCAASYEFRRGFVHEVTMNAASFAKHGQRIFERHPIETLRLRPLTPDTLGQLAETPALAFVPRLVLQNFVGHGAALPLSRLCRSDHLARLDELVVDHCDLDPLDLEIGFARMRAPSLRSLDWTDAPMAPASLGALAKNPAPPPLRRLRISRACEAEPLELQALARDLGESPAFWGLEDVSLDVWRAERWPFEAWFAGVNASQMTGLSLGAAFDGDIAARAIADAALPRLRTLDLEGTSLTMLGLRALLASAVAKRLEALRVPVWLRPSLPVSLR